MEAVINIPLITELQDLMGEDFAVLLATYRSDTESRIRNIENYFAGKQFVELVSDAHSLKGSSANIGAVAMELVCGQLVSSGREEASEAISHLLQELKQHYSEFNEAIDLHLS